MTLIVQALRLAETVQRMPGAESAMVDSGRLIGKEFVHALRVGACLDIDILAPTLVIAEQAGPQAFRGFLRELEEALREVTA